MGCNTSKSNKNVLTPSPPEHILENGAGKMQNGVHEMGNDIAVQDLQKGNLLDLQEDLQQVGEGLTAAVNEGMNEPLVENGNIPQKSDNEEKVEEDDNGRDRRSLTSKMHSIEAIVENVEIETEETEIAEPPIPPTDGLKEYETDIEDPTNAVIIAEQNITEPEPSEEVEEM